MRGLPGWKIGPMNKKKILHMAEMAAGSRGLIREITSGPGLTRRLEEMGIRTGKNLTKVSGRPLGGPVVV